MTTSSTATESSAATGAGSTLDNWSRQGDEQASINLREMMLDMINLALWRAITEGRVTIHDDDRR